MVQDSVGNDMWGHCARKFNMFSSHAAAVCGPIKICLKERKANINATEWMSLWSSSIPIMIGDLLEMYAELSLI